MPKTVRAGGPPSHGGPGSGHYDHHHNGPSQLGKPHLPFFKHPLSSLPKLRPITPPAAEPDKGSKLKYNLPEGMGKEQAKTYPLHSSWHPHPNWKQQAYGGVLVRNDGKFLLREPANHFDGYAWTWPKGKVDHPEDHPVETATREVKEETGYNGRIFDAVPGTFSSGTGSKSNFYLMRTHGTGGDEPDAETQGMKWVSYNEAKDLINQSPNKLGRLRDLAILEYAHNRIQKHRRLDGALQSAAEDVGPISAWGQRLIARGDGLESYLFQLACTEEWDESQHPRDKSGKFAPSGKFHQHGAVLQHYGWQKVGETKAPNPAHPKQLSTMTSTWSHPQHGSITIDHMAHTYSHAGTGATQSTGKKNVNLESYLHDQKHKNDVPPEPVVEKQAIPAIPAEPKFESHNILPKDKVEIHEPVHQIQDHPTAAVTPALKPAAPEHVKDGPLQVPAATANEFPAPAGMHNEYQHTKYGHVYKFNPDTKVYDKFQKGVTLTNEPFKPSKVKWMADKGYVQPNEPKTILKPAETPVTQAPVKQDAHAVAKAHGYSLLKNDSIGGSTYSKDDGSKLHVYGDGSWLSTPVTGKGGIGSNEKDLQEHLTKLASTPVANETEKAEKVAATHGFDDVYKSPLGSTNMSKKLGDGGLSNESLYIKPGGGWKHLSESGQATHGEGADELDDHLKKQAAFAMHNVAKSHGYTMYHANPSGSMLYDKKSSGFDSDLKTHPDGSWEEADNEGKKTTGTGIQSLHDHLTKEEEKAKSAAVANPTPAATPTYDPAHLKTPAYANTVAEALVNNGFYKTAELQTKQKFKNAAGFNIEQFKKSGKWKLYSPYSKKVAVSSGFTNHSLKSKLNQHNDDAAQVHNLAIVNGYKDVSHSQHPGTTKTYALDPSATYKNTIKLKPDGSWVHDGEDYGSQTKGTGPAQLSTFLADPSKKPAQPATPRPVAKTKAVPVPVVKTVVEPQKNLDHPDSSFQFAGNANDLGGAHAKYFYTKGGDKYMFKPAETMGGVKAPMMAHAEEAASKIAQIVRPGAAIESEANAVDVPGKGTTVGSMQKFVPDSALASKGNFKGVAPKDLTEADKKGLQQEHVLDWLISNHDAHGAQFIRTKDGNVIGIDKAQAFKYFPNDKLDTDYHPNQKYGEAEPYYSTLFKAVKSGDTKIDPNDALPAIQKAQAIPELTYRKMLTPYAASTFQNTDDANKFLDAAVARKDGLRSDMEKFYQGVTGDKDFHFKSGLAKSDSMPDTTHNLLNSLSWEKHVDGNEVDNYKHSGSANMLTVNKTTGKWAVKDTVTNTWGKQGNDFDSLNNYLTGGKAIAPEMKKPAAKGNPIVKPSAYSANPAPEKVPQAVHEALEDAGFKFNKLGAQSGKPLYKDSAGKAVYVNGNSWEYYPMGTSGANKQYGQEHGTGVEDLTKSVTAPFEKPQSAAPSAYSYGSGSNYGTKSHINPVTGKLSTPNYPELEDKPYEPVNDKYPKKGTGKEAGYQIGGTPTSNVDASGKYHPESKSAMSNYKGSGYHSINQYLAQNKHKDIADATDHTGKLAKAIDDAVHLGKINKDLILFRKVTDSSSDNHYASDIINSAKIGVPFPAYAFQSTATHQAFSHHWGGHQDGLVLRLRVPKGTPAVAVEKIQGHSDGSDGEHEIVLSRHTSYTPTDIYTSDGTVYMDADVKYEPPKHGVKAAAADAEDPYFGSWQHYLDVLHGADNEGEIQQCLTKLYDEQGNDITPQGWKDTARRVAVKAAQYDQQLLQAQLKKREQALKSKNG